MLSYRDYCDLADSVEFLWERSADLHHDLLPGAHEQKLQFGEDSSKHATSETQYDGRYYHDHINNHRHFNLNGINRFLLILSDIIWTYVHVYIVFRWALKPGSENS